MQGPMSVRISNLKPNRIRIEFRVSIRAVERQTPRRDTHKRRSRAAPPRLCRQRKRCQNQVKINQSKLTTEKLTAILVRINPQILDTNGAPQAKMRPTTTTKTTTTSTATYKPINEHCRTQNHRVQSQLRRPQLSVC